MRLIDKDELLRELKRRSDVAAEARMGLIERDFIDLVNDAETVEVPEWIPVTPETMPPDNKRVLAIAEEYWGNFVIGRYYRGEGWEFEGWDDDVTLTITHWLSIPDELDVAYLPANTKINVVSKQMADGTEWWQRSIHPLDADAGTAGGEEMRLIDADALLESMAIIAKKMARSDAQKALMGRVIYILEHRPEQVVRCKDCKQFIQKYDMRSGRKLHYGICKLNTNIFHDEEVRCEHFCGYGAKMDIEASKNGIDGR